MSIVCPAALVERFSHLTVVLVPLRDEADLDADIFPALLTRPLYFSFFLLEKEKDTVL